MAFRGPPPRPLSLLAPPPIPELLSVRFPAVLPPCARLWVATASLQERTFKTKACCSPGMATRGLPPKPLCRLVPPLIPLLLSAPSPAVPPPRAPPLVGISTPQTPGRDCCSPGRDK